MTRGIDELRNHLITTTVVTRPKRTLDIYLSHGYQLLGSKIVQISPLFARLTALGELVGGSGTKLSVCVEFGEPSVP